MTTFAKSLLFFLSFLLITVTISAQDEGINFFEGSWEEALVKAQKERKIIFVDAYTTWCGPCKRMAKEVFTQKVVGEYYNKHFINVKLDMEKGEGIQFGQKYEVNSYPTLLFIDEKGVVVNVSKGMLPVDQFVVLGKATLNKFDKSKDYAKEYEEGNRAPEFLRAYAYALLVSSKPTLKIANEYLKTQSDLKSPENLDFIFDFASEADCSIFDKLVDLRQELLKAKGEDTFKDQVEKACDVTVLKAVEYSTPNLVNEAKSKMKAAFPSFAAEYALKADIRYAFAINDLEKGISLTEKYVKKFAAKDPEKLNHHALLFGQIVVDTKKLALAEKWAETAYNLDKKPAYARTYIMLLRKNGKQEEATKLEQELKSKEG